MTSLSITGKDSLALVSRVPSTTSLRELSTTVETIRGSRITNHWTSSLQGGSVSLPIYMNQVLETESLSRIWVMLTYASIHFWVSKFFYSLAGHLRNENCSRIASFSFSILTNFSESSLKKPMPILESNYFLLPFFSFSSSKATSLVAMRSLSISEIKNDMAMRLLSLVW